MSEKNITTNLSGAYRSILNFWNRFGTLPDENTKPMQVVMHRIHRYSRYNGYNYSGKKISGNALDDLFTFSKTLDELGCNDKFLCGIYHCPEFDSEPVQERVREMLIENGSCAVKYIAEMSIPGVSLPEEFVYYYYYSCAYDRDDYWKIRPLGFLYAIDEDFGRHFLRVHFRDYSKCKVTDIRNSAQSHYRNWSENPPQTLEDWKYYGQWGLFVDDYYKEVGQMKLISEDWSETIIDASFKKSERYFYVYDRFKYFDYLLYLLENGYVLYKSDVNRWVEGWLECEGFTPEDKSIRQKVKELLKIKGINLNNLLEYGSI